MSRITVPPISVDFARKTITVTKAFIRKAKDPNDQAYRDLQKVKDENPDFVVQVREIKKSLNKETYRGLTYTYMKGYISSHDNSEKNLAAFMEMITITGCHSNKYPRVKEWFLEQYPEIKEYWCQPDREKSPSTQVVSPVSSKVEINQECA